MQVKIADTAPAAGFNLSKLQNAFRHHADGTGVFESSVSTRSSSGRPPYNSAYGTNFVASSNCNTARQQPCTRCDGPGLGSTTPELRLQHPGATERTRLAIPVEPKAHARRDELDDLRRVRADDGEPRARGPAADTRVSRTSRSYPFVNPPTELIDATNLPKQNVAYDANGARRDVKSRRSRRLGRHPGLEDHAQRRGHPPDPLPPVRRAGAQPGHLGQHHHPDPTRPSSAGRTPSAISPLAGHHRCPPADHPRGPVRSPEQRSGRSTR